MTLGIAWRLLYVSVSGCTFAAKYIALAEKERAMEITDRTQQAEVLKGGPVSDDHSEGLR